MNKQDALDKIEELKAFVEGLGRKPNVITEGKFDEWIISGNWGFSMNRNESQGGDKRGSLISGHESSLYLASCYGTWFDQSGVEIEGYLFYKPNGEA